MATSASQATNLEPSDLDSRSQALLRMLVERYIESGESIASKWLASLPDVKVSSATVRNVMASLEQRGLVRSPHTSAGKVPTNEGLRFFVNSLVQVTPMDDCPADCRDLNNYIVRSSNICAPSRIIRHLL